jgi:hypothetical protein
MYKLGARHMCKQAIACGGFRPVSSISPHATGRPMSLLSRAAPTQEITHLLQGCPGGPNVSLSLSPIKLQTFFFFHTVLCQRGK